VFDGDILNTLHEEEKWQESQECDENSNSESKGDGTGKMG
jgi:hypothetical protein